MKMSPSPATAGDDHAPAVEGMFDRAFKQAFYVDGNVSQATATIARDIQGVLGDRLTVPSYLFREGMTEIEE